MRSTPEPPSLAESATSVAAVCQPAQEAPSHSIAVTGAVPSLVTVKDVAAEVSPALFVAVTSFGSDGSAADASKLYAPPLPLQPDPRLGYPYEAIPDCVSLDDGVSV